MKDLNFTITKKELEYFISMLKELTKIHNVLKLKFFKNKTIFYTVNQEDNGKINALKLFNIDECIFKNFPTNIELSYNIMDGKKLAEKLSNILCVDETYNVDLNYNNETNEIYCFTAKNLLLEIRAVSQSSNGVKDLTLEKIKDILNVNYADYHFEMSDDNLKQVNKLSKLDATNILLEVRSDKGKVKIVDSDWNLEVFNNPEIENDNFHIKKEYLKQIINHSNDKPLYFYIFSTHIIVDENESLYLFNKDLFE